jgi:hypothetical protein
MTAPADPPASGARSGDLTSTTVSSGGSGSPPRRSRTGTRRSVSSVSATVGAPPVAAPLDEPPAEAELSEDDTGQTTRARRRTKPTKQPKQKAPKASKTRTVAVPRGERRVRQTIQKVDLWTVLKLSLCFYLSAMFVTLIAIVALWMVAEAAGIIGSVEKFLGDLLSAKDFKFLSGEVLRGAILVTLVLVALQVVLTVIAASFYNIFAELFGGLEITVKEEDQGEQ